MLFSVPQDLTYSILNYFISNSHELNVILLLGKPKISLDYLKFKTITYGYVPLEWNIFSLQGLGIWEDVIISLSTKLKHCGFFAGEFFTPLLLSQPIINKDIYFYEFQDCEDEFIRILRHNSCILDIEHLYIRDEMHILKLRVTAARQNAIMNFSMFESRSNKRTSPQKILSAFNTNFSRCGVYKGRTFASIDAIHARKTRRAIFYDSEEKKDCEQYRLICTDNYNVFSDNIKVINNLFYIDAYITQQIPILQQVYIDLKVTILQNNGAGANQLMLRKQPLQNLLGQLKKIYTAPLYDPEFEREYCSMHICDCEAADCFCDNYIVLTNRLTEDHMKAGIITVRFSICRTLWKAHVL